MSHSPYNLILIILFILLILTRKGVYLELVSVLDPNKILFKSIISCNPLIPYGLPY